MWLKYIFLITITTIPPPQFATHTRELKFGYIVTEFVYTVDCFKGTFWPY